jgi:molybdate transport system ATP-binding protein
MADNSLSLDLRIEFAATDLHVQLETESPAVAIVGPSGAGKSTILRILAGVERRARGVVRVGSVAWQDSDAGVWVPPWKRKVGWFPQDVLLFPHLSVRENLAYGTPPNTPVEEIATLLQIAPLMERRPKRLSGGERQRVALGRALVSEPELLLLDEPFSALDRALRAELSEMVRSWAQQRGVPVVLVSHDEEDARTLGQERFRLTGGALSKEA